MRNLSVALVVLLICGYSILGEQSLFCYRCKATDGNCENYTSAESYDCYDQLGDFTKNVAVTCYSTFINYSGRVDQFGNARDSETGVYRECGIIADYLGDYCEWFIAELALNNIPVVSCEWCNKSYCNKHTFDLKTGLITGNSVKGGSVLSLVLLALNICLMYVIM
ncbi:uncharacterized protein [Euwallacea fornicatus]|uniref:uncharacterized protein n=1 Tax=Euwallacea fornicatus TaxID=995702 RepID=UPI00338D7D29